MISEGKPSMKAFCPVDKKDGCAGTLCRAWRTVDGDTDHGFCGMVPVLPYQLRSDSVGQNYNPKMVL